MRNGGHFHVLRLADCAFNGTFYPQSASAPDRDKIFEIGLVECARVTFLSVVDRSS